MNKLFYGDNLDVMRKFIRDETVDICYFDPPFNSKHNYNQIYNNIGTEDHYLKLDCESERNGLFSFRI